MAVERADGAFGRLLCQYRLAARLTQGALAARAGLEDGERFQAAARPSGTFALVAALCDAQLLLVLGWSPGR
jgi:hypothetical protein